MRKLYFLIPLLFASAVTAADKPPEITPFVKAEKAYGKGTVTYAFFTIYDAALWTDAKPFSMDKPFALKLIYHHSLTRKGLVEKTIELMADIDKVPEEKLKNYHTQLMAIWSDVNDGDSITAIYQPGGKTQFFFNGKPSGIIADPEFGKPFFDIWLSEKTTEPAARKKLLKGDGS